jgi:CheY-like chemotaxis protein
LSDLSKEIILLVGQNLFFLGRVENLAEPLGYEVQRATTESAFWDTYGSGQVALILVDLEGDESIWSKVLGGIHQQEAERVKVVGFGPHENVTTLERARDLGCDLVLNKGEFNRDLPKIIERRGKLCP